MTAVNRDLLATVTTKMHVLCERVLRPIVNKQPIRSVIYRRHNTDYLLHIEC